MDSRVGYRFQPTPEELVNHFLKKKRLDPAFTYHDIKDLNIYEHHPCELPDLLFQSDKQVGYFFCILDQKYAKSGRVKRTAKGGSWKITGRDLKVKAKHTDKLIGFKKTLVFYKGSNCKKENRTNWVMHEYHAYHEGHHNKKPVFKGKTFSVLQGLQFCKRRTRRNWFMHDYHAYLEDHGNKQPVFKIEPDQLLQNHYLPSSSSNYIENTNLVELGSQPLPIHQMSPKKKLES